MKLSQNQQEKITLAIQAVLGVLVIGLSVRNSVKVQTAQMKKLAKQDAKQIKKINKTESKMKNKLLKQQYKAKLRRAKAFGSQSLFPRK